MQCIFRHQSLVYTSAVLFRSPRLECQFFTCIFRICRLISFAISHVVVGVDLSLWQIIASRASNFENGGKCLPFFVCVCVPKQRTRNIPRVVLPRDSAQKCRNGIFRLIFRLFQALKWNFRVRPQILHVSHKIGFMLLGPECGGLLCTWFRMSNSILKS